MLKKERTYDLQIWERKSDLLTWEIEKSQLSEKELTLILAYGSRDEDKYLKSKNQKNKENGSTIYH